MNASTATGHQRVAGSAMWPILAALVVAELLSAYETASAVQLLFAPQALFGGTDLPTLSWILTAFMLSGAVFVAFAGRLGDQFGRRKVLLAVIVLSIIGSVISAVAPNIGIVILGRAIQGAAGAILPLAFGIIRESLPVDKHGLGIAVVSTTALIAGASGLLVGGIILDHIGWHFIFWVSASIGVLAVMLVTVFVPKSQSESLDSDSRIDYWGALLFGAGTVLILYALTRAQSTGWTDPPILIMIVAGIVALALWTFWELRVDYPMINLRRFRNRKFAAGMLVTALLGVGPVGMGNVVVTAINRTPTGPQLSSGAAEFPVGIGLTATMAGLIGLVGASIAFAGSPIIGRIATRWGARATLLIGCFINIVGFMFMLIAPANMWFVIPGAIIFAVGTGFTYSGMPTIIAESVADHEVSAATGLNVVVRTAFQGIAATVAAVLMTIDEIGTGPTSAMSLTGLHWTIGTMLVVLVVAIIVLLRIPAFNEETDSRFEESETDVPLENSERP